MPTTNLRHIHILLRLLPFMLMSIAPRALAQATFERGLEQISFIPKGQWITGVNVSYTQSDFDNYKFLIIENLHGDTYSFKVSPMLLYCFQDNLAAGGRFAYSRTRTRLNSADVILDSETSWKMMINSITSSYCFQHTSPKFCRCSPKLRKHIPM